jgi:hypothetical protein
LREEIIRRSTYKTEAAVENKGRSRGHQLDQRSGTGPKARVGAEARETANWKEQERVD